MEGEHVYLRPVEARDLELLARIDTDPTWSGLAWTGFRDPQRHRRRFEGDGYLGGDESRLVAALPDGSFGGVVAWRPVTIDGGFREWCLEIGIILLPEYRGRGLGAEAQRLLADYLFSTTPVYRIQAGSDLDNVAERRALERAGFRQEGIVRGAGFGRGEPRDRVRYARLRNDPAPFAESTREEAAARPMADGYAVTIRRAAAADLQTVAELASDWEREGDTAGQVAEPASWFESQLDHYLFVAEIGDQVVGYAVGASQVSGANNTVVMEAGTKYLEVLDLYVRPERRSKGIGSALLTNLLAASRTDGIERSLLFTGAGDIDAVMRFYRQHGYRPWGLHMER